MVRIMKIGILLAALLFVFYFVMAQKAYRVKQVRMYERYEKHEITKSDFDAFISTYSLKDALVDPKFVLSVD